MTCIGHGWCSEESKARLFIGMGSKTCLQSANLHIWKYQQHNEISYKIKQKQYYNVQSTRAIVLVEVQCIDIYCRHTFSPSDINFLLFPFHKLVRYFLCALYKLVFVTFVKLILCIQESTIYNIFIEIHSNTNYIGINKHLQSSSAFFRQINIDIILLLHTCNIIIIQI